MSNPNLNQIPQKGEEGKTIRSCFIPRNEDYIIVGGDYGQMELRIVAEFSQDPLWVETFRSGGDLHSILCSETFDISLDRVREPFPANPDITYRSLQKTINFGLIYGMSPFKLSDTARITVKEAEDIINKFFNKVPKVKKFLDSLGRKGRKRGFIRTSPPYSRYRIFPKWNYIQDNPSFHLNNKWMGEIERASKNHPIQGSNGDIIKQALINTQEEIDNNNWNTNILLSIYDEIQTECIREQAEDWRDKLQEMMINAAKIVVKTVPIVVDVKITEYWTK